MASLFVCRVQPRMRPATKARRRRPPSAASDDPALPVEWMRPLEGAGEAGRGWAPQSGNMQPSNTCRSLSLAKFMTKSQAMGSILRRDSFTTTHLTPPRLVGKQ